jgi:hypothetical protein
MNRRRFLGGAGGHVPRKRRGIQLYTMRRVMDNSQAEARAGLRRLGAMGYTEVEPYWRFEWTPQQFRRELDPAGLKVLASHDGLDIDPESTTWRDSYRENLVYAAALGQQYGRLAGAADPRRDGAAYGTR